MTQPDDPQALQQPGVFADLEEAGEQDIATAWLSALGALKEEHRVFLLKYIEHGCAKQAALEAKYSEEYARDARTVLLGRADIRKALDIWLEAHTLRPKEVMAQISEISTASAADFYRYEDGDLILDLDAETAKTKLKAVKSLKFNKDGVLTNFELYDRKAALDSLARFHGLYEDKLTVTGMTQDTIVEQVKGRAADMDDEELEKQIEQRLDG